MQVFIRKIMKSRYSLPLLLLLLFLGACTQEGSDYYSNSSGTGGSLARFTVSGSNNNYLYTIERDAIKVFDLQQSEMRFVGEVNIQSNDAETVFPYNNKLFIGTETGMHVYALDNPEQPTYETGFWHVRACDPVVVWDSYAFITLRTGSTCGGTENLLQVVDVANTQEPQLVFEAALENPYGLAVKDGLLFVCDGSAGLKVYDVKNPTNPRILNSYEGFEPFDAIALDGTLLVVTRSGLKQFTYSLDGTLTEISEISIEA